MYSITDEQVDFILEDIKANGVILEDLQNNLLDHICCIIEHEMPEGEDFLRFYRKILPRFFKTSLKEIQEETEILLTFKNYYAMKRTLKISGIASALLTITGALLKTFHLPGAGMAIVLGGLLFCLVFLPLMIALKFKDEEKQVDKWVFTLGFLLAMGATAGIVFKLMHWPMANILMRVSITAFVFGYVPLYYLTRVRRAELRFNTTVNAVLMMACGGMLYALTNLGLSKKTNDSPGASETYAESSRSRIENANDELIKQLPAGDSLAELHQVSNELEDKIDDIRQRLIADAEGIPVKQAKKVKTNELCNMYDVETVDRLFTKGSGNLSKSGLEKTITDYNKKLNSYFPEREEIQIRFAELQLENATLIVLLNELTQIQLQLATNEYSLLSAAR